MSGTFSILRDRQYSKYALAAILTTVGGAMHFIAMSWFLFKLTGTASSIGWILIISALPGLLFSPWIGVLVDRWNNKHICVAADLLRGACVLGVAVAMLFDVATVPLVYAVTFIIAICDNFFQPAVAALVRNTVDKERLLAANVMSSTSMQIGGLAGAGLGGLLVASIGTAPVVLANAVSFFVSAALTQWIVTRAIPKAEQPVRAKRLMAEFRSVVPYMAEHRYILQLALLQLFVFLTLSVCNTLLPAFIVKVLHSDAAAFGLIDSAWGAGALIGAQALAYLVRKVSRQQFGVAALFLLAAAGLVFATALTVLQGMIGYFFLGFLTCAIRINTDTILVSEVGPEYFGKVKATIAMFISFISIAVYGCVGYLGDVVNLRYLFAMLSCLTLAASLGALWFSRPGVAAALRKS